ncbi:MAG: hypothetical protein QOD01_1075, partial [Actinomycetota bacterium]|nr:hypothetical protein [Actinomycetota bacterium]
MAGQHQPEGVELGLPFRRKGLRLENGARLGPKGAPRYTQGVRKRLEHGEPLNLLDTSFHLGYPAFGAPESRPKFTLRQGLVAAGALRLAQEREGCPRVSRGGSASLMPLET